MVFGLDEDVVARVLVEELTGSPPTALTIDVPMEFRLKIREEIAEAQEAGIVVDIPEV